jgi:hypothetical protein
MCDDRWPVNHENLAPDLATSESSSARSSSSMRRPGERQAKLEVMRAILLARIREKVVPRG